MSNFCKPKLVIFEGCDKVGKSTLFRKFREATHYIPLAIDRFTGSNYVYDSYYGRESLLSEYLTSESWIQDIFDCYLVLLVAPLDILEQRIVNKEEGKAREVALDNFECIQGGFVVYYENETKYQKKLMIDTGIYTEDEALELILNFTGEKDRR